MKKKWLPTLLILLPLIIVSTYIQRINFAETVSFTFNGLSESDFKEVNVYGYSPLNRKLHFHKTNNINNFSSLGNKTYLNAIVIEIHDTILKKCDTIVFEIGNELFTATSSNLNHICDVENATSGRYRIKNTLSHAGVADILSAYKTWPHGIRRGMLLFIVASVLAIAIVIFVKSNLFAPLRKALKQMSATLKKGLSGLFYKKLFFKTTLFFTVALAVVFFVIMHFGIFCHFSAFIFLFFVYGCLLLLSFALKRLVKAETLAGIRLMLTTFFVIFVIVEFFLRFFLVNASYLERNLLCYERVFGLYNNSRYYTRTEGFDIDYTTTEFRYYRKVYPGGFTQELPPMTKQENEFRILGLGDSFTEGVGVSSDSTWLKQLEHKLTQTYPHYTFTTFNAGVVSSDPVFQYVLLTEKFSNYGFDMVIAATNESDQLDVVLRGGFERFLPDSTVMYRDRPKWEWLYGLSYIFRLAVINGLGYNHILMKQEEFEERRIEALKVLYEAEEKFYNYAKKEDVDMLYVFHPTTSEVLNPDYFYLSHIVSKLRSKYKDIHLVDLNTYYINTVKMNRNNIYDYYWKIDGHHNGKGYEKFSQGIFDYIAANKLIPEKDTLILP